MIASALVAGMTVRAVLRVAVVTCIEFPAIGMLGVLVWKGACLGSKGSFALVFFFFWIKAHLCLFWDERLIWAVGGVVPWLRKSETGGLAI